jgi:hypothetical protein
LTSDRRASAVARFVAGVALYGSRRSIGPDECAGAGEVVDGTALPALLAPCVGVALEVCELSSRRVVPSGRSAGAC